MKKNYFLLSLFLLLSRMATSQDIPALRVKAKEVFKMGASNTATNYTSRILNQTFSVGNCSETWQDLDELPVIVAIDPIDHLKELTYLAKGYANGIHLTQAYLNLGYTQIDLTETINDGLDYFFCLDYANSNAGWHDRKISAQRELQAISSLFFDQLTTARKDAILSFFWENTDNTNSSDPDDQFTGANKADIATSILAKGLLGYDTALPANDPDNIFYRDLISTGKVAIECTMDFSTAEFYFDGIREDYSFQQHNDEYDNNRGLLYAGGYGQSLIHNVATWGSILQVDPYYALDSNKKVTFFDFILKGYRWMVIGNNTDYSANGRYISRKYPNNNAAIDEDDMELLIEIALLDSNIGNEIASDLDDMNVLAQGGSPQGITGNKHFWKSDYVCHHTANYFSSVKMCSARTNGTESIDDENILGFWLPFGCTFIYRDGTEYIRPDGSGYENIFPCWNWAFVPGVTCPGDDNDDVPAFVGNYSTQSSAFVGSANNEYDAYEGNEEFGVTAMDLVGTVLAKKSWFHFGDEIIALGAGISGPAGLHTTINQTLISGTLLEGTADQYTKWFQHDDIAYILPYDAFVYPNGQSYETEWAENKSGNWNLIGTSSGSVTADVFKSWINHTEDNSSSYYYIIAPSQDAESYADNNPVTLLKNTGFIQAVKKVEQDGDVLAGIVYYPGSETLPIETKEVQITPNITLYTNKPCALLYDGNTGQVCISSPTRDETDLVLTVKENVIGGEVTEAITFDLPEDVDAGTSICMDIFDITRGNVTNHCGGGISGVEIYDHEYSSIYWYPNTATLLSITNLNGNYSIARRTTENFTIDPKKDIDFLNGETIEDVFLNGVTIEDVLLLQDHILAAPGSVLDSPYKKIAADVNFDGETTWDAWILNRLLTDPFYYFHINTDSWEFVEADHQFPPLGNPSLFIPVPPNYPIWPFPQTIDITSPSNNNNFLGMKMGDLNCDALNGFGSPCEDEVKILIEDKVITTNELFTVTLHVENFTNIRTYQFGLDFRSDKIQYQGIQQGNLTKGASIENFALSAVNNGSIKNIWHQNDATVPTYTVRDTSLSDGASLFKVQFKALENITSLYGLLKLSDETFHAKAWSGEDDCFHPISLELMPVGWSSGRNDDLGDENKINKIRVYPNPTSGDITFEINTDTDAENTIQIYSTTGQQVLRQSVYLEKGNNTIPMDNISDWQDGLYFYMITDASGLLRRGKFAKN